MHDGHREAILGQCRQLRLKAPELWLKVVDLRLAAQERRHTCSGGGS
jgi:hypothetical protein